MQRQKGLLSDLSLQGLIVDSAHHAYYASVVNEDVNVKQKEYSCFAALSVNNVNLQPIG